MNILAHRGCWHAPEDKNSRLALQRAFSAGFGVETDIRDLDGTLVVCHDLPFQGALLLTAVLEDYVRAGSPGPLALNIKSDGLTKKLHQLLEHHGITQCSSSRYFCFDMSVPDTLPYLKTGLVTAARISEYEPEGPLSALTQVLWVDGFYGLDVSAGRLQGWLNQGYQVCLVSPELHGRPHLALWEALASLPIALRLHDNLMLCTDYPYDAREVLA